MRFHAERVLFAMATLLLACGGSSQGDFSDHQKLWAQKGPHSYQYVYTGTGMAPHLALDVTVENGVVTHTVRDDTGEEVTGGLTVEQLFEDVSHLLASDCHVTVSYDATFGYPTQVSSDCGSESDGWTATDLTPQS